MHYYQHHIGDFIKDTSYLTNEEIGIYMKLIWLYYDTEQPLPDDIFVLSMKTNARENEESVKGILGMYFQLIDDKWHHTRCDKEIAEYQAFCVKQKANGLKGGRPKVTQQEPNDNPMGFQVEPKITLTTNHKPLTNISTPDGVSTDLWSDFIAYRKRLKAPVTNRVVTRLIKESKDANMTLEQAIETMIFKGWRSFDATWITKEVKPKQAWE
jgi:uncharacterized protein YdaU (DUF1376 family)